MNRPFKLIAALMLLAGACWWGFHQASQPAALKQPFEISSSGRSVVQKNTANPAAVADTVSLATNFAATPKNSRSQLASPKVEALPLIKTADVLPRNVSPEEQQEIIKKLKATLGDQPLSKADEKIIETYSANTTSAAILERIFSQTKGGRIIPGADFDQEVNTREQEVKQERTNQPASTGRYQDGTALAIDPYAEHHSLDGNSVNQQNEDHSSLPYFSQVGTAQARP